MASLFEPNRNSAVEPDPDEIFRTGKYELNGRGITVIQSPYDFTKQTPGAAEGTNYLLDERDLMGTIKQTGADVQRKVIDIGVLSEDAEPDPNIRHKDATINLAQKTGAEIEEALKAGRQVVVFRGAHDAADLAGVLRATGGNVIVVIIDTHTDIHKPSTSTSKNSHGMWVSVLLGEGEGLDPIMKDTPLLKPENVIYIGPSQLESAEMKRLIEKGIKVFSIPKLNKEGWGGVYDSLDEAQKRAPLWMDLDEDGRKNASATMPGGRVPDDQLNGIANRVGTNQQLEGMHKVLGVAISEFQAPEPGDKKQNKRAKKRAEGIKDFVHQSLGAGYRESSTDTGEKAVVKPRRGISTLGKILYGTTAAVALLVATAGGFLGKNVMDNAPVTGAKKSDAGLKTGHLLAGTSEAKFRDIFDYTWEPRYMKEEGKDAVQVFSYWMTEHGYAKEFQDICDGIKGDVSVKGRATSPYMRDQTLSEMASYLFKAESMDPRSATRLQDVLRAHFETGFEKGPGRTTAKEGLDAFNVFYQDFKNRNRA